MFWAVSWVRSKETEAATVARTSRPVNHVGKRESLSSYRYMEVSMAAPVEEFLTVAISAAMDASITRGSCWTLRVLSWATHQSFRSEAVAETAGAMGVPLTVALS